MARFDSVDGTLDFAIQREEESVRLYTDLAAKMERPAMRQVFEGFAREEQKHKEKLQLVKDGEIPAPWAEKVAGLEVSDYFVEVEVTPAMSYQDALIVAMKKEKAAFRLYNDLADASDDEGLRQLLLGLAREEAGHKLRFEIEYDDYVLQEG